MSFQRIQKVFLHEDDYKPPHHIMLPWTPVELKVRKYKTLIIDPNHDRDTNKKWEEQILW